MPEVITNKDLADQHAKIMSMIRDFGTEIISNQRRVISMLESIGKELGNIRDLCNEIKNNTVVLSDNQAILDSKLNDIKVKLDRIENNVERLMVLLPGI